MARTKKKSAEHSPKFELVKSYYDRGLWSIDRVRKAVSCGWITAEEFTEITGQPYEAQEV